MYLILEKEEAQKRNKVEAILRDCEPPTTKYWGEIEHGDKIALDVGDGTGLTDDELKNCVDSLED